MAIGNNAEIKTRNIIDLQDQCGNIYKAVKVIGNRANQIATTSKEELNAKLAEFSSSVDNLEEVFENREQIEISKFYERMPKPSKVALEAFLEGDVYYRERDDK
jgi:DNA-directed RNA polymerase subunit K/omega